MAIIEWQVGIRKHSVTAKTSTNRRETTEERNFPRTGGIPGKTWVGPPNAGITQPLWSTRILRMVPELGNPLLSC